jgi:hypothetical protein
VPKQGGYTLQGTPPFIIQTHSTNTSSTVSEPSHNYTECNIYHLTDATGCPGDNLPPIPSIAGFNTSAASICVGQSVTLTANATNAQLYSFDDGVNANWQTGATKVVSPTSTTTYTLKVTRTAGGCTVTYGTPIEITVHPLPAPAFVNPPAGLCLNSEATLTVTDPNNAASSYCFTYECAGCVKNAYLTGNDEPAAAGCHWFSDCQYGTANTYTVSMYDAGTITVRAEAISDYGCVNSTSAVIRGSYVAPPVISGASSNTCPNTTVTLTATATGATSFAWYKDGSQVQNGSNKSYTVSTSGSYTVRGYNAYCSPEVSSAHFVSRYCCSEQTKAPLTFIENTMLTDFKGSLANAIAYCQNAGYRTPTLAEITCMCAEKKYIYTFANPNNGFMTSTTGDAMYNVCVRWGTCGGFNCMASSTVNQHKCVY